jgi:hypothetical protein
MDDPQFRTSEGSILTDKSKHMSNYQMARWRMKKAHKKGLQMWIVYFNTVLNTTIYNYLKGVYFKS